MSDDDATREGVSFSIDWSAIERLPFLRCDFCLRKAREEVDIFLLEYGNSRNGSAKRTESAAEEAAAMALADVVEVVEVEKG